MRRRHFLNLALASAATLPGNIVRAEGAAAPDPLKEQISVRRLADRPIIVPGMDERMGSNINGPSLIRTPDWLPGRLGTYYLYFSHHAGAFIRLAYADDLLGPWRIHSPGVLDLEDSYFVHHIASPDVHVDPDTRQLRLYCHGKVSLESPTQKTRCALSSDGLHFTSDERIILDWYARVFEWGGAYYALTMPGRIWRSADGRHFEPGPLLFGPEMRHSAVLVRGHALLVFYTNVGDSPEGILLSRIDLRNNWMAWRETSRETVLKPETAWEGADLPLAASRRGGTGTPANQLRDPAIYVENGRTYLLYAVAGEFGIAIAEVFFERPPGSV